MVILATASVEILWQAMMDQASHYRWTEDNNVASVHVQPPFLCMVYDRCWDLLKASSDMPSSCNKAIRAALQRTKIQELSSSSYISYLFFSSRVYDGENPGSQFKAALSSVNVKPFHHLFCLLSVSPQKMP